jgi:hypothetical protein
MNEIMKKLTLNYCKLLTAINNCYLQTTCSKRLKAKFGNSVFYPPNSGRQFLFPLLFFFSQATTTVAERKGEKRMKIANRTSINNTT